MPLATGAGAGQLTIQAIDRASGRPLASRMHLKNSAGRQPKVAKAVTWNDHVTFDGSVTLKLPAGNYSFEMECGPEYLARQGHFSIADFADDTKIVDMHRFVDLAKEGWWSGDLDVQRSPRDIDLLMRAEDLHIVQVITSANGKPLAKKFSGSQTNGPTLGTTPIQFGQDRFYGLSAMRESSDGGMRLLLQGKPSSERAAPPQDLPTRELIEQPSQRSDLWSDVSAASWDLPMWIAQGRVDSISLADGHLWRTGVDSKQAGQRPRDPSLYAGSQGVGRWPEAIYYRLLNCGLRFPPTAGSGSGITPNPVGYNRLYVHVDGELTYDKWWQSLRQGKVFVTNGPLIRAEVEGEPPGHVFRVLDGQQIELEIELKLSTRETIDYLEIVKDGKVAHVVRLDALAKAGGKLPKLQFKEGGWFLLRAVADNRQTYRFASTGPFYVEIGNRQRISRSSVKFFLDWLAERAKLTSGRGAGSEKLLEEAESARKYWEALAGKATVD